MATDQASHEASTRQAHTDGHPSTIVYLRGRQNILPADSADKMVHACGTVQYIIRYLTMLNKFY